MIRVRESVYGVKQGDEFGRREVLGKPFAIGKMWFVVCRCQCGKVQVVGAWDLAHSKSGGCASCQSGGHNRTHGETGKSRTPLYIAWSNMRQRCNNPNDKAFADYGGRGISVFCEWGESYEAFRNWALANGYRDDLEIDRINNDGNYEPDNCRFVTSKQNTRNKRNNRLLTVYGETKCIAEWAEQKNIKVVTLHNRISRFGWTDEDAVMTPVRKKAVSHAN